MAVKDVVTSVGFREVCQTFVGVEWAALLILPQTGAAVDISFVTTRMGLIE